MAQGDNLLLKADTDDGYTRLANLILEALALSKLSGVQKGICEFIFRRTYGWGQKEDEITLAEFAAACNSSSSYISKQLKQLIHWKVITRHNYEPGKTPSYSFNTRVAQWDKGCLNVQGLYEKTMQGLYKSARVGLNKCTTPEPTPALDITKPDDPPKERVKESLKENTLPPFPPENHSPITPQTVEEIISSFKRYSTDQLKTIADYWEVIRFTRKHSKVAPGIVQKEMEYWERFPADTVIDSLSLHSRKYQSKQESYTRGIIRRSQAEKEALERRGGQSDDSYSRRGTQSQGIIERGQGKFANFSRGVTHPQPVSNTS